MKRRRGMKKVPCPMCKGEDTAENPCKACGGGKRVTRKVGKAIKSMMVSIKTPGMANMALAYIADLRNLEAERERLAALPVPASFLDELPDTPESRAARVQTLVSQGVSEEIARERVFGRGGRGKKAAGGAPGVKVDMVHQSF